MHEHDQSPMSLVEVSEVRLAYRNLVDHRRAAHVALLVPRADRVTHAPAAHRWTTLADTRARNWPSFMQAKRTKSGWQLYEGSDVHGRPWKLLCCMRREHGNNPHASSQARLDSRGSIFKHDAILWLSPEHGRTSQVRFRIWLPTAPGFWGGQRAWKRQLSGS